ncbi:MAG: AraC family transcriptional regulator [Kiritimatiellia bacterium]
MTKPSFMSKQVDQAACYCLNLTATGKEPLTIVCGGREHCRPDYLIRRKTFRYRAIEFVAGGQGELLLAGRQFRLMPGIAFSYGPGTPHQIRTDADNPMTKYFIDFTGTEADALINATALGRGPVLVSEPNRVHRLFDDMQRQAFGLTPQKESICLLLLRLIPLTIDALAGRISTGGSQAAQSYARCKYYIDEHFMTLNTLADVTQACHMDPASICRLFKRFSDQTPYQYLLRRKMQHAAARLQRGDLLIKELADEMGYADPYHFSRSFKHVHGISPQRLLELTCRQPAHKTAKPARDKFTPATHRKIASGA